MPNIFQASYILLKLVSKGFSMELFNRFYSYRLNDKSFISFFEKQLLGVRQGSLKSFLDTRRQTVRYFIQMRADDVQIGGAFILANHYFRDFGTPHLQGVLTATVIYRGRKQSV